MDWDAIRRRSYLGGVVATVTGAELAPETDDATTLRGLATAAD